MGLSFTSHKPKASSRAAKPVTVKPGTVKPKAAEPARPTPEPKPKEIGGPSGPEPTRYGDWERKGVCVDF